MHGWLVFGRKSICPVGVDGTDFLTLDYTSEMLKKSNNFPLKDGWVSTENAWQIRQLYPYHWTLSLHGNEPNDKGRRQSCDANVGRRMKL